jgi:hypothetical protein
MLKNFPQTACVAAAIVLATMAQHASADEQADQVEQLALDFLQKGESDPTSSQKVGDAGVDFAVGLLSLGFESMGVPGAGVALGALKSLFGSNVEAVPPVIEKRLRDLEGNVATLRGNIDGLTVKVVRLENDMRLAQLKPISAAIGDRALQLPRVREMTAMEKKILVAGALKEASQLLPPQSPSIWEWTNVRVKGDPQMHNALRPKAEKPAQTVNIALPLYLQALGVLTSAMDATGIRPPKNDLAPHLYFVGGSKPDVSPLPGLPALLESIDSISCSVIREPKSAGGRAAFYGPSVHRASIVPDGATTPEGYCSVPVQCSNPVISIAKTAQFQQWEQPKAACSLVGVDLDPANLTVRAEVEKASAKVVDLLATAYQSLSNAGVTSGQFDPASYELDTLYAVNRDGGLLKMQHLIAKRPRGSLRPNKFKLLVAKCSPANARVSIECRSEIANTTVVSHTLSRAKLEGGSWAHLTSVVPSEWRGQDLLVYAVQPSGDLRWRRIANVTSGPNAPAEPMQDAPIPVASGWSAVRQVFSTGQGVIYSVASNGELVWYRNLNTANAAAQEHWQQHLVGVGWGQFERMFSPGEGVIYAIKADGTLLWYKHEGYLTGGRYTDTGAWKGPKQVGVGWNQFKQVFAAPEGHIYAVNTNGDLIYYKHAGWRDGEATWDPPVQLGTGWGDFVHVFAAMGGRPSGPRVN